MQVEFIIQSINILALNPSIMSKRKLEETNLRSNIMFVVILNYKKPLEMIDQCLAAHRHFLDGCYAKNYLIASGPKNPRTGGILISQLKNREQLEQILQEDPFQIQGMADYEFIEFTPVKHHPDFAAFVS
jgi:uncharacterized protein YciI